jgi:monovalent cation:H+ antiporter, CPA1 family
VILIVLAILVVIVASRLQFPYTIALIGLGFALGVVAPWVGIRALPHGLASVLTPNFFFDLILPPIVFEAAIHIDYHRLRARIGIVLFLVFVGVIFTTLFAGILVAYLVGLPILVGLLLAAILSPTDPVAVVDLFRRLHVPEGLSTIVESESLLNDAVGIIMFLVVLDVIRTGTAQPWPYLVLFARLSLVGVAIGLAVALAVYLISDRLRDATTLTALSVVAAYGSYLLATDLGGSGIIAAAIAGIAIGSWAAPRAIGRDAWGTLTTFWEVVVYLANSVIFLTMGLVFGLAHLGPYLALIGIVFGLLVVGRAIYTYGFRAVARRETDPARAIPPAWYNVITLAGIRGAIPVVLALSLLTTSTPLSHGTVDTIIAATLGVVLFSMVVLNLGSEWYALREFGNPARSERTDPS